MGRHDEFSVAVVANRNLNLGKEIQKMLGNLQNVERQAIELVRVFQRDGYVPLPMLLERLQKQPLPEVKLDCLVSFLIGYLSAETFHSKFDNAVWGGMGIGEDKTLLVNPALVALLNLMSEHGLMELPNRVPPPAQRVQRETKKKVVKKKKVGNKP